MVSRNRKWWSGVESGVEVEYRSPVFNGRVSGKSISNQRKMSY